MTPIRPLLVAGLMLAASPALSEVPRVVTDIPVVASLVQQVMGDLGRPETLLAQGGDAHHYQLRPSDARRLQQADLLVWVGPALTPWLERASGGLGRDATALALLDLPDTRRRPYGGEADHGDDHGHDHSGTDPHAWLDPGNAGVWLDAIAQALAGRDPQNAATYAGNALRARDAIAALDGALRAQLEPARGKRFVTFHDAYGHFTAHYGLEPATALSLGDASTPSAARLKAIRAEIAAEGAACAFPEANHDSRLIETVVEGTGARTGATLDPEGSSQPPGAGLYAELLRGLAGALSDCLGAKP